MKIAYLILAHNNPNHLNRLVQSISSPNAVIFIHIDKKSALKDFYRNYGSNVTFLEKRIPVYWGDFSIVEATFLLIKEAISQPIDFDYFVLLSGSDYPIHSTAYIENFFRRNHGKEFINLVPMPNDQAGKSLSRLIRYRLSKRTPWIARSIIQLLLKLGIISRDRDYQKTFGNIIPYGGSQWWGLSREAIKYIMEFHNREPKIVRFFHNTKCPDEMIFQTIIGNSFLMGKTKRNFTYADWSGGGSSPAILGIRHIELFRNTRKLVIDDNYGKGEVLFARKFTDESCAIVDQIDQLRHE